MPSRARRLTTALFVILGLLAPTSVATAATSGPDGTALQIAPRNTDGAQARTSSTDPIVVRDLAYSCPDGHVPRSDFGDVGRGYAFAGAIDCLVGYGITQGRTADAYAPNEPVTRAQMAVFLHRLLDDAMVLPTAPTRSRFGDVAATGEIGRAINVLASDELAAMLGVRVVAGRTADTYDPTATVTRAQMGSFIARTFEGLLEVKGFEITDRGRCDNVFSDEVRIQPAHVANVKLLCSSGIVTGRSDGSYGPVADVTRGQMAAFLMRTMDIVVEAGLQRPAHERVELFVDRGMGVEPCADVGRNGSSDSPFCTIYAAANAAELLTDQQVRIWVRWRPGQPAYDELGFIIDAGETAVLDIVGLASNGARVPFTEPFEVDGDAGTYTTLGRMQITAPDAVGVFTAGYFALSDVRTDGDVGVLVGQPETGDTYLLGSDLRAAEASVGVFSTGLLESRGTRYAGTPPAYVVLEISGAPSAAVAQLFEDHFTDPALGNRFDRTPVIGEFEGLPALVPAS